MSELIDNNRKRKEDLKEIIKTLNKSEDHERTRSEMKKRFSKILKTLSPEEIAEAEQALIQEGMAVEEVQKLCEIHVDAFEDTLKKNRAKDRGAARLAKMPGHPIATYRAENARLKIELRHFGRELKAARKTLSTEHLAHAFESVSRIEVHYERKENQLFPYLENAGFTGPSKVMWGKHDEIRESMRAFRTALAEGNIEQCRIRGTGMIRAMKRMVFMEEKILFPTALTKLPEAIWIAIRRGEAAIGYAWIKPGNLWDPNVAESAVRDKPPEAHDTGAESRLPLDTGELTLEQINLMLKNLPVDISFVDEHDIVRYYSDNADRIFPRSPGVIGRAVQNCHPPSSVHVVQKIVDDFRSGKREVAEFWIQMRGKFVHIRYFPVFSGDTYRGVIEVSQEVSGIRSLEGEKRILDGEKD